jgi:hypothetical protein
LELLKMASGRENIKFGRWWRSGSDVLRRDKEVRRLLGWMPVADLPAVNQLGMA